MLLYVANPSTLPVFSLFCICWFYFIWNLYHTVDLKKNPCSASSNHKAPITVSYLPKYGFTWTEHMDVFDIKGSLKDV